ncbi:MAG: hypothetical protein WC782_08925 [Methylococcaceae bacterium]|jgi:hypothetical protein
MRFGLPTFFAAIALASLVLATPTLSAATIGYLYIEASEGNSSGGHVALQFGDEIFHFQHHDSGLIRLIRQDQQEFHYQYRYLQNRPLHISQIAVSEQTFDLLNRHFKLQFLAQEQQFQQLHALQNQRLLLRRWIYLKTTEPAFWDTDFSKLLRLNAVGLFYDENALAQGDNTHTTDTNHTPSVCATLMQKLQHTVALQYGPNYLPQRNAQINAQIEAFSLGYSPLTQPILSKDNFPPKLDDIASRFTDLLTGMAAVNVLQSAQCIKNTALLLTQEPLSGADKIYLRKLHEQLTLGFINTLNSQRPDWGLAVLVNIARLTALEQSLHSGYWVFVDDFGDDSIWLTAEQYAADAAQIQPQIDEARVNFNQRRNAFSSPEGMNETDYSQLEMSANRYNELLKGQRKQRLRYLGEKALPSQSVALPEWLAPKLSLAQLTTALNQLEHYGQQLSQTLAKQYRYDLISRNCVTELFRTINLAFLSQDTSTAEAPGALLQMTLESGKRLGAYLPADDNVIPFLSYKTVQQRYTVANSIDLNSYRGLHLAQLLKQNDSWLTGIRESNILTSTLYDYNPDDALFVFFTDDNWLLRPVFGLFNTAAGVSQSLFGLFSAPFDAGKNLESGLTGVLMSLPELAFFNIRKGSYRYLPYSQFLQDEKQVNFD